MKHPILFAVLALLMSALTALAALCEKCADCSYTKDIGKCVVCGGMTTSGQFALCMSCSSKLGQCQHCRAALTDAGATEAIDTSKDGVYRAGAWTYEVRITNPGTRSQGCVGTLSFEGRPVVDPDHVNDYHVTPWGKLYWVGQPIVPFGAHGWMPMPLAREKEGEALSAPQPAPHSEPEHS